jgi:hypothetical protein
MSSAAQFARNAFYCTALGAIECRSVRLPDYPTFCRRIVSNKIGSEPRMHFRSGSGVRWRQSEQSLRNIPWRINPGTLRRGC